MSDTKTPTVGQAPSLMAVPSSGLICSPEEKQARHFIRMAIGAPPDFYVPEWKIRAILNKAAEDSGEHIEGVQPRRRTPLADTTG